MNDSEIPLVPDAGATGPEPMTPPAVGALSVGWQEQDNILRDMWMQNKTPQEISTALSRSVAAIMTRAARLGLPRRSAPGRKPGSRRVDIRDQNGQTVRATASRTMAPTEAEAQPQASTRICLMCLRSFRSMGRHNRICSSCKSSSEYSAAMSTSDIHFPV